MKRLRRAAALLTLSAALFLFAVQPVAATVYLDVRSSDWFTPAVSYAVRKGLFLSVSRGHARTNYLA